MKKQTICLCMIVKNEAPVIRRCLDSVRPFIDHWVIVDTGSTDGTQDIIKNHFTDVPGTLYEREWKDFAHNRSEALALARNCANYSLIIDADDYMRPLPELEMPELTLDSYTFDIEDVPLRYPRTQLVNNQLKWVYRGVLHEFIFCEENKTTGSLPWQMVRNHDGARRNDPTTYQKDAQIFLRALETETDAFLQTRYTFYLAQSFRDSKNLTEAVRYYEKRGEMGGWNEEVFYSYYQVGRLKELLDAPVEEILSAYEKATNANTQRVEAIHAASKFCRVKQLYQRGYDIAVLGLGKPYPADALFGEPLLYQVGLLDELAVNAYWIQRYDECIAACLQILRVAKMEGDELLRVIHNLEYAIKMKVAEATTAASNQIAS